MANARAGNEKDIKNFSYLVVLCETLQGHILFSKDHVKLAYEIAQECLDIAAGTSRTLSDADLRVMRYEQGEQFSAYREAFRLAFDLNGFRKPTFTETIQKVMDIRNKTHPDQFDFDTAAEPYFNFLRTFLGKARWQLNIPKFPIIPATAIDPLFPNEMWGEIFFHLPFNERLRMRQVNRFFKKIFNNIPITDTIIENDVFAIVVNIPNIGANTITAPTYPQLLLRVADASDTEKQSVMESSQNYATHFRLNGKILHGWGSTSVSDSHIIFDNRNFRMSTILVSWGVAISAIATPAAFIAPFFYTLPYLAALCALPGVPIILLSIAALALMVFAGAMIYKAIQHDKIINETTQARLTGATAVSFFKQADDTKKLHEQASTLLIENIEEANDRLGLNPA